MPKSKHRKKTLLKEKSKKKEWCFWKWKWNERKFKNKCIGYDSFCNIKIIVVMGKTTNKTVKEHLEETYLLDKGFWYETHITPNTPWFQITVHQLNAIADALDEDVRDIINPKY